MKQKDFDAVRSDIARYRAYGWEWGVIANLIRYRYGFVLSANELRERYTRRTDGRGGLPGTR